MKYLKSKWMIIGVLLVAIGALAAFKFESGKAPQYFTEKAQGRAIFHCAPTR
jgi:hypothetical protein